MKNHHFLLALVTTPLSIGVAKAGVDDMIVLDSDLSASPSPVFTVDSDPIYTSATSATAKINYGTVESIQPLNQDIKNSSDQPLISTATMIAQTEFYLPLEDISFNPAITPNFTIAEVTSRINPIDSKPKIVVQSEPVKVAGLAEPILGEEEKVALINSTIESSETVKEQEASQNSGLVFNTSFLRGGQNVDLDELLNSGVLPGQYEVLITVNDQPIKNALLNFKKNNRTKRVEACLSLELLSQVGVDTDKLIAEKRLDPNAPNDCLDLPLIMDKAAQQYNSERFRLLISIPQVYLKEEMNSYPDPSTWDYGVNALVSQYSSSYSQSWNSGNDNSGRLSSSFRNRANLFGFRFYNTGSLTYSSGDTLKYSSFSTYGEHDVDLLKAQFRFGDIYAGAHGLDGVGLRGIQLADDLSMQPGLEQTFRPALRGVAETSSTVEVRQQGFLILTTTVPPGPFELRDIPNVASDGDMEVTLIGADGRRTVTIQPWIATANILTPGFFTYTASLGQYDNYSSDNSPNLTVGSFDYRYGLNEYISISGGTQVANGYLANAASFATATPIGPVSIDIRHSVSKVGDSNTTGGGIGFTYSKAYDPYGLTFTIASQRFTSKGFRSLSEHATARANPQNFENINNVKLVSSMSLSKRFEDAKWGSLYATLSDTQYWNNPHGATSVTMGYNNSYAGIYFGVSGSYTKNVSNDPNTKDSKGLTFNVSIPLGTDEYPVRVNASYKTGSGFDSNQSLSKTGDFFLDTQRFNYAAYVNGNHRRLDAIGANLSTSTSYGNYSTSLTSSSSYTNLNFGATGGVVLHGGGINFTNNSTDTLALVKVPDQSGVQIGNTRTGFNGYAVVPVNAYQNNQILVGKDLDPNVDIVQDVGLNVVPRRDAVVATKFDIITGRRVEFTISTPDEKRIPFGAVLTDPTGKNLGITDPFGKALVLLPDNITQLKADWGNDSCTFEFTLPPVDPNIYFEKQAITCTPIPKE